VSMMRWAGTALLAAAACVDVDVEPAPYAIQYEIAVTTACPSCWVIEFNGHTLAPAIDESGAVSYTAAGTPGAWIDIERVDDPEDVERLQIESRCSSEDLIVVGESAEFFFNEGMRPRLLESCRFCYFDDAPPLGC